MANVGEFVLRTCIVSSERQTGWIRRRVGPGRSGLVGRRQSDEDSLVTGKIQRMETGIDKSYIGQGGLTSGKNVKRQGMNKVK